MIGTVNKTFELFTGTPAIAIHIPAWHHKYCHKDQLCVIQWTIVQLEAWNLFPQNYSSIFRNKNMEFTVLWMTTIPINQGWKDCTVSLLSYSQEMLLLEFTSCYHIELPNGVSLFLNSLFFTRELSSLTESSKMIAPQL